MFKAGDQVRVINKLSGMPIGAVYKVAWAGSETFTTAESPQFSRTCAFYELVEEKKMEYKVGKKYRSSWDDKAVIWTCVWKNIQGLATFCNEAGNDAAIALPEDTFWTEVKEKITVTRYVHWFRRTSDKNLLWSFINHMPTPDFKQSLLYGGNYIKTDVITCEVEVL